MRALRLISLCLLAALALSCSTARQVLPQPIVAVNQTVEKYNFQLDLRKTHFSGLLAVRTMEDTGEIRLIAVSYFGLSLFDFGLRGDTFTVYSCIEPLQNKRLLALLENDFKLLFLPGRPVRSVKQKTGFTQYTQGRCLTKSVVRKPQAEDSLQRVAIRHPFLGLKLTLEQL